jgi:hypothetical protein
MTSIIWSFLIGGSYYLIRKQKLSAVIVGCAVFSHWIIDFISHTPDLPLLPGGALLVGLGLWNSTIATILIESGLFIIGVLFYFRVTRSIDRIGIFAPWSLIIFLSISYIASIASPSPSNAGLVGWMALSQWLFVPWGYWIDRHRETKTSKE